MFYFFYIATLVHSLYEVSSAHEFISKLKKIQAKILFCCCTDDNKFEVVINLVSLGILMKSKRMSNVMELERVEI